MRGHTEIKHAVPSEPPRGKEQRFPATNATMVTHDAKGNWECGGQKLSVGAGEEISSGHEMNSRGQALSASKAFQGQIDAEGGWQSQEHKSAGQAWIGFAKAEAVGVGCVRLYQSAQVVILSEDNYDWTYWANRVKLQKRVDSADEWSDVSSWGNVTKDRNLPGRTWLTLAVGQATVHKAFSECATVEDTRVYMACCAWSALTSMTLGGSEDHCTPLATVKGDAECDVSSSECGKVGTVRCVHGKALVEVDKSGTCAAKYANHPSGQGGPPLLSALDGDQG